MKIFICLALVAAVTASPARSRRGVIHQESEGHGSEGGSSSSGYHHEVEHEHAKSHQSIKLEHFHPVPVYVKKEHSHLLKHPLEKGKSEHGIKLLHPKTEHHHGYGLVLEEHRKDIEAHKGHELDNHGFSDHSDHISEIEHIPEHHEISEHSQGISDEGGHESYGWGAGSEQVSAYESHGLQDVGGHYQYSPIDLTHLGGGHEAEGGEGY